MILKNKPTKLVVICGLGFMLAITGCGKKEAAAPQTTGGKPAASATGQSQKPDYWPTAAWKTTTPEAQGMDSAVLADSLNAYKDHDLHSVVVIRNGYLVAEAYNKDTQPDKLQELYSATKSFTSALTGIALTEKKLSLDQKVSDFFPELANDPKKATMKVGHLLYMASGLEWNNENEQSTEELMASPDWMKYITGRPAANQPGTMFNYSNGDAHLMSGILQKATGQALSDYARTRLFEPLGIVNAAWKKDPQGYSIGAWSLQITARDMARLGFLYLNQGEWNGKQILPKSWVQLSWDKNAPQKYTDGTQGGYGYFWWMKKLAPDSEGAASKQDVFFAAGSGGQRIFVVPGLNLIVVTTANNDKEAIMPEQLLYSVAKSIKSDKPLPDNAGATAKWNQAVEAFKLVKDRQ